MGDWIALRWAARSSGKVERLVRDGIGAAEEDRDRALASVIQAHRRSIESTTDR
jgi:hypothetical protein